jgi:hypothetical protein
MQVTIECFKTLKDFQNNANYRKGNGKGGVYVWGFSLGDDFSIPTSCNMFFPYYVGKHYKDMYSRTHEHVTTLTGGNYSIFDILQCSLNGTKIGIVHNDYQNDSKKAKPSGGMQLPNAKYNNLLYFPEGVHRHYDFFFDGVISKQIDWMLKHFCILYINPVGNFSSNDIDNLEKKIGQLIGYDRLITKPYNEDLSNVKVEIVNDLKTITLEKYEDLFKNCQELKL